LFADPQESYGIYYSDYILSGEVGFVVETTRVPFALGFSEDPCEGYVFTVAEWHQLLESDEKFRFGAL
jgi:hypothetical protein